jgi:hypothetical protein
MVFYFILSMHCVRIAKIHDLYNITSTNLVCISLHVQGNKNATRKMYTTTEDIAGNYKKL